MKTKKILNIILTITVLFTTVASAIQPVTASAQQQDNEIVRAYNAETGKVSMLSGADNQPIAEVSAMVGALSNEERADALIQKFAPEFGVAAANLKTKKQTQPAEGRITTRYQQTYNNVPVIGGELIVNANDQGEMYSMNGETAQGLALDTNPAITNETAIQIAKQGMVKWYGGEAANYVQTSATLSIFDEKLLQPSSRPAELVWQIEMISADQSQPVREFVLVDAKNGNVPLHFNQIDTAWSEAKVSPRQDEPPVAPTATPAPTFTPTPQPVDPPATPEPVNPSLPAMTPTPMPADQPTQEPEVNALVAATYYVNIASGSNGNNCTSTSTPCKNIQETINKAASGDTIKVASGTYYYSYPQSPNVVILNGKNLTLSGGWDSTFATQNGASIIDGSNPSTGVKTNNGILLLSGTVIFDQFIVQNSTSTNSGAIYIVSGNFTLQNSTLKNNTAVESGAGIFIDFGALTVINSTISGNTAGLSGGGIYAARQSPSAVTIQNSTIAYNTAAYGGGVTTALGVIYSITNSIIANNTATTSGPDCKYAITTANYNIITTMTGCTITTGSNNINVDPQIDGALSGTMQVHALLAGSPAIDAGTATNCPTTDQRGVPRPQGVGCDIGATEYYDPASSIPTTISVFSGSGQNAKISTAFASPLVAVVRDQYGSLMQGVTVTFTAPANGASGAFADATSTTNASGLATASAFTANSATGNYIVEATVNGIATPAQFQLANYIPSPTTISITAGTPQLAGINTTFSSPLSALVKDQFSSPMQGATVTFTAPASGASGTFADNSTRTTVVTTNSNGVAISPVFTANNLAGTYTIAATIENSASVSFQITNSGNQYVSPSGTNGAACNNPVAPCQTINYAIGKAVANDVIYIAEGTYTASSGNEVASISKNLTLSGGWNSTFTNQNKITIIDGQKLRSGIYIGYGITATVDHVIVQNGYDSNNGGGINVSSNATLTLRNSTITNNNIGILSGGSFTAINSAISFNSPGGGIKSSGGSSTLLNIQNSTIVYNQASSGGGINIDNYAQQVSIKNSIIANNVASTSSTNGQDCYRYESPYSTPSIITSENNIIGKANGCTFPTGTENHYNVDPQISAYPIGDLHYFALLPGSPAINAGNPATCTLVDQRGASRLLDTCDIGAYEYTTPGSASSFGISAGNNQNIGLTLPSSTPLAVYAMDAAGAPVSGVSITFTAPASGSTGTFTDTGTNTTTVDTDSSGLAVAPAFTANLQTGSYSVTVGASGLPSSLNFNLTNRALFVSNAGSDTGNCDTSAAPCSTINYAISKAKTGDVVLVASGIYTASSGLQVVYVYRSPQLNSLTLLGGWNNSFTVQTGMSVIDGEKERRGIASSISLTVDRFIMQNIKNSGVDASAFNNIITITITNSTIQNSAAVGVMFYSSNGNLIIKNSTITGNANDGILHTTFDSHGGGVSVACDFCSATIINSTIVNNYYGISAGNVGVGVPDPTVNVYNSIVANNQYSNGNAANCTKINIAKNSIFGNVSGCTITSNINSQLNVASPLLSKYPVGIQAYHALLPGSPAIDAGDPATCLALDQRGMPRPQGGACDIGAYEYVTSGSPAFLGIATGTSQRIRTFSPVTSPMAVYVVDGNGSPVSGVDVTFAAPASGASGVFADSGTNTTIVATDEGGIAEAPVFTTNATPGIFHIDISMSGVTYTYFYIESVGWYVSNTGSDANSCSSPSAPCRTINAGINKAAIGDVVYIESGTHTSSAAEVVYVNKEIKLSGGWDADFILQNGFTTLDGQNTRRGISNAGYSLNKVVLENFIIENGFSAYMGGGIYFYGSVELRNSIIRNNSVFYSDSLTFDYGNGDGGGIFGRTITLINSRVENNSANNEGGGIHGGVSITSSMIKDNTAKNGGGVYALENSVITNSIIIHNTADNDGGGVSFNSSGGTGSKLINNSNIINNKSGHANAAVNNQGGSAVHLQNSLFVHNIVRDGSECDSPGGSLENSLVISLKNCVSVNPISTIDPLLSPYFIGFPAGYQPLMAGSPAIGAGNPATCASTDQRGLNRLQDGVCDIGAYEYATPGTADAAIIPSGYFSDFLAVSVPGQPMLTPLAVAIVDSAGSPVPNASVTFTAPSTGAGGTFAGSGTNVRSVVTDGYGIAAAPDFIPNNQYGAYQIATSGIPHPATFNMTTRARFVSPAGSNANGNTCADSSQPCGSINTAIAQALPGDGILITAGTYTESINVAKSVIIVGGWDAAYTTQNGKTFIDGQNTRQNILVNKRALALITALNVVNGYAAKGSGIYNHGYLALNNMSIYNNTAIREGAGIYQQGGSLSLTNVTVSNNTGNSSGGGIYVSDGVVNINNSTIAQNAAVDPNFPAIGGGLSNPFNKPVTISNTIIAANASDSNPDCRGQITSGGHNLIGFIDTCALSTASGDQVGISSLNPKLGNLLDNGGRTLTHALLTGSPAIDAGNPATCAPADQRGISRPQGAACDIGAFEGNEAQTVLPTVRTYSSLNQNIMPGVLRCDQNQPNCTNGSDGHADKAQQFALGTYNLYLDKHGRNGIDNNNMPILSSVHYQPDSASAYGNAFWSGTQMVYGDAYGFTNADDVVAHELTHGVTQYESNLYYFYQSGAISESLSDVFGEYYDQTNGLGNDLPEVKWLLGEDVTGASPIRSLSNPPLYGDPDKMTSALYNKKSAIQNGFDEGGVHSNSGVNNKAVYLMVDGGAFNYKTITALGWDKTAAIYYEVQTNLLSSGSDYSDLYYAVQQACANLSLTNFKGITLADCVQVKNALDAVEMSKQPAANFHVDATLCPAGSSTGVATTLFSDNFENGVDKWSISLPWKLDNSYSSSSTHSIWGDDAPTSYYSGMSMKVKLPEGTSYLYFKHAFGFEYYNNYYYDGGMIEYTADNGASFHDIKPLFSAGKNYTGVILNHPQSQNPLKGYAGFVGDSHGYTSSRYNLTPLAGKDVTFIWGMGTDQKYSYIGWHIDDVSVYTCVGSSSIPALTTPANNTLVNEYKPLLDWTDVTTNFHHYQVQVATDSAFTTASLVSDENNIITSQYAIPTNLNLNTPYYWRVRSFNAVDETKGWSPVWKFTTGDVPATFNMQSPFNNSTNQPTILTLKWSKSDGITPAAYYEYCYALTKNSACTSWRNVGLNTSADLRGLLPEKTYYWQVRAFNFFGQTQANSSTWNSFTTGQTKTGNYYSQSANDGWTLESSETSNLASTKSNSGKLRVGDDIRNKQYRSLLYFDTASVPDKAVISKVTLKIHKASVIGTDPITSHGDLIADMKKGFFGLSPLELTDFNAAAGLVNIGKFTLIGGDWYQLTLSPLNFNYINLIGATQFRIRFVLDDNNNKIANIALFDSGADANQPQLIIEYTAP